MDRKIEQLGLGFLEQEDNSPMETNFGIEEHEPINVHTVVAAVQRLKGYHDDRSNVERVGKLFALPANIQTKYTFHTYRQPTEQDILSGKSPREMVREELSLDEQYQCQEILKSIDLDAELANLKPVQELGNVDQVEKVDDDVLFTKADGTKVYKQDRYDRERGTY